MDTWFRPVVKFVKSPPKRSFYIYPLTVLLWELFVRDGRLAFEPFYLILMIWGYGQFQFCHRYHREVGGRGPDLKPWERLVTSGIYRYTRNPMYLGHIIFLTGLALTLRSVLAALFALGTAAWFHYRVLGEERRMIELYGDAYLDYMKQVKRWIPGLF